MKKMFEKLNRFIAVVAYVVVVLPIELLAMNGFIACGWWIEECLATIKHGFLSKIFKNKSK